MYFRLAVLLPCLCLLGREVVGNAIRQKRSEGEAEAETEEKASHPPHPLDGKTPEEQAVILEKFGWDARTIYNTHHVGALSDLAPPGDNGRIDVHMKLWLRRIDGLDVEHGIFDAVAWLDMSWEDSRWAWAGHHDIPKMVFPANMVWKPDIILLNDDSQNGHHTVMDQDIRIQVTSHGNVLFAEPLHIHAACDNISHEEPKDGSTYSCTLSFCSWAFTARRLLPVIDKSTGIVDLTPQHPNQHWSVIHTEAHVVTQYFEGLPDEYASADFTFTLQYHDSDHDHGHDHHDDHQHR